MVAYWVTGILLILYLVFVWFLGSWLHLKSPDVWVLRGGLALIGIVAAASFVWFYRKAKRSEGGEQQPTQSDGNEDIDLLVHEALNALRKSTLGRGATLRNLPLLFFLGESGSAKTNIIVHSGLDPELLAGQVYQDNNILTTRLANIWYSQHAVLVDPAGNLLQQPDRWKRLVQSVRPGRASSALSKSQQAPRAAVLCFDCANFLRAGASEATISAARKLGARLHEISQTLSISLPVYVLFTKLDRLQGFTEFARGLTPDESSQVLGTTLPMRSLASGVYSEEETKRLNNAFDELFFSLADRRLELLARENDSDSLASIYEFPRELRKLRTLLVQFLVELARPSRLKVNPFLRGFYFSGVRPVFVEDGVSAAPQPSAPDARFDGGATQVFGSLPVQQVVAAPARAAGRRKVPQWTFLTRLFNDVIVKDRVALAASGVSSNVSLIRRVSLITVAALSLVAMVGFLVSYLGNRELENNVRAAAADVGSVHFGAHQLPSISDLQKLDKLRQELNTLAEYDAQGVPLHLRWFLYVGDRIRPDAKRVYFSAFRQMLFDDAQSIILSDLRQLPAQPGPNDPNNAYETAYDELKAHLITAQYYNKSTKENPGRVMGERWAKARGVDPQVATLAQRQFDYYSSELMSVDPLGTKQDGAAVAHARSYLANFGGIERFYRPLVNQASDANPAADFTAKFPNAAGSVSSRHVVRGAYTPAGYKFMTDAVRDPARFLAAEEWVLGKTTASDLDPATLQQRLLQRYQNDYIDEWQNVLKTAHVSDFGLKEADQKLDRLTASDSPLLELLWFVSSNTNVDHVKDVFASVQNAVMPGAPDKLPEQLKQQSNDGYVQSLSALRNNLDVLISSPTGPADSNLVNQVNSTAASARTAATQLAGSRLDNTYHTPQTVQAFLEEPIIYVERAIGNVSLTPLNAAGKALCQQFDVLASVFPLKPTSSSEVTIEEFNNFFSHKTGALWSLYNQQLSKLVTKEGGRYVAVAGGTTKINPRFLTFFNRMAEVSDTLYPNNAGTPNFTYGLMVEPNNVQGLILTIGDVALSQAGQQKTFTWAGVPEEVRVTAGQQTLRHYSGTWAAVRFVMSGTEITKSYTNLRWNLLQSDGSPITINGQQEFYEYKLQTGSPNPFELLTSAGTRCEPTIALK